MNTKGEIMNKTRILKSVVLVVFILLMSTSKIYAWGSTGHRAIALIAYEKLDKKVKAQIESILGSDYLPYFANWADEVRSEKDNPYAKMPHYVNMPLDIDYAQAEKSEYGDVVTILNAMVAQLKNVNSTNEEKAIALKMIIHLVGDIHQPMHVSLKEDLGGNKLAVKWYGEDNNLHKVWDEGLIDYSRLSYTELAQFAEVSGKKEIESDNSNFESWADETHQITRKIYNNLGNLDYSYAYSKEYMPVVFEQVNLAGNRLALLLNDIFTK